MGCCGHASLLLQARPLLLPSCFFPNPQGVHVNDMHVKHILEALGMCYFNAAASAAWCCGCCRSKLLLLPSCCRSLLLLHHALAATACCRSMLLLPHAAVAAACCCSVLFFFFFLSLLGQSLDPFGPGTTPLSCFLLRTGTKPECRWCRQPPGTLPPR